MGKIGTLDREIATYVDLLSVKQKKVVLSVAKAFVEEDNARDAGDKAYSSEMERRFEDLESGKVKGYTWEEVKKITRSALSEIKSK